ncbi:unnamed protein product [Callosobruchus maculatus]|uniref:Uncharacterized protein n=1 Tax=Callosobruchus maculatus TaxID=64391 RepID=A0A653D3F1_CALMS|nr:unnamed protein product [Callosobruchus maculatus]
MTIHHENAVIMILNVICSPTSEKSNGSLNGHHHTPRRASQHVDSFSRLFGNSDNRKPTPRRGSLNNQDVTNRNPVTGSGVTSWDCRPASRNNTPKVHIGIPNRQSGYNSDQACAERIRPPKWLLHSSAERTFRPIHTHDERKRKPNHEWQCYA